MSQSQTDSALNTLGCYEEALDILRGFPEGARTDAYNRVVARLERLIETSLNQLDRGSPAPSVAARLLPVKPFGPPDP